MYLRRLLVLSAAMIATPFPQVPASGEPDQYVPPLTVLEQTGEANYHIPNLVVANDGTVLAFCEERWKSPWDNVAECHIVLRRSLDHGRTWLPMQTLRRAEGGNYHMGSACVDRNTGDALRLAETPAPALATKAPTPPSWRSTRGPAQGWSAIRQS